MTPSASLRIESPTPDRSPELARSIWVWPHASFVGHVADACENPGPEQAFTLVRWQVAPATPIDHVQRALAAFVAPRDVVGTCGPGRYEILLRGASSEAAHARLAQLRAAAGDDAVRITTASFPIDGRDPDELFARCGAPWTSESEGGGLIAPVDGAMIQLYRMVERVAPGAINVLILGETGVGKDVIAEQIHRHSTRADRPLLRVNCAALSQTLLENELFGHDRGGYGGALAGKPGLIESADGGTVFLDEVGELPLSTQVKLLRVLQERQVVRANGQRSATLDVRFLAATNRDLDSAIAAGTFRQDLLFRLNAITLVVPPLRDRPGDLDALCEAFLNVAAMRAGLPAVPQLSREVSDRFRSHDWPGNVRELRNVLERAVLMCGGDVIRLEHLPPEPVRVTQTNSQAADAGGPIAGPHDLRAELRRLEHRRILEALEYCGGNQTAAAALLRMPRRTFAKRMDLYRVQRPRKRFVD